MNTSVKRAELERQGNEIISELDRIERSGVKTVPAALSQKFNRWEADMKDLQWHENRNNLSGKFAKLKASGGDLGSAPSIPEKKATGSVVSPLFNMEHLKVAYKAFENNAPVKVQCETKAYSTIESLLPAQLAPGIVEHIHEWRILDHLPSQAIDRPSYEFLIHNYPNDTLGGNSAPFTTPIVAEGGLKPEYVAAMTQATTTAEKIAFNTAISRESLMDFDAFLGYITTECFRLIGDFENQQLLYGNGTGQMTGLFNTSGILSHNCSSDPGGWTALDSVEASIETMRIGSSLNEPNLFITHPSVWAALRRTKTTTNAYVAGDPLRSAVNTLWGIPVLVSTVVTPGQGLLIDTTRFGTALIREGWSMQQGYSGTDFIQNITRWVFETRAGLAVFRPQSVLSIANLPTS